jgi:hypothetical protein
MNFARTLAAVSVTGTALGLALAPVASAPASAAIAATKATAAPESATATRAATATKIATATAGATARKAAVPVSATGPVGVKTIPATAAEKKPVVVTCEKAKVTEPKTYTLACGDGSEVLASLSWSRWSPGRAIAGGKDWINDCEPNCATGKFHSYPVYVAFQGGADVYGHPGEVRYTRYRLIYPGQRPPGVPDPRTGQLPA